jgi:predicted nucleotidyltransferase
MSHSINLLRLKAVSNALMPLHTQVVFVGGATVSLYADRKAEEVRPTDDVDVLIEIWAYKDYAAIEEQCRNLGFENDKESGIIGRYKVQGITVDIMTTTDDVLGFTNKWYKNGFRDSIEYSIDDDCSIRIFTAPYFIASKLEAFKSPDRLNNNDGIYSSDFEDIIFVLENRLSIWEDIKKADNNLNEYLRHEFGQLMNNPFFEEWIEAHLSYSLVPATQYIIDDIKQFIT